jgi:hypothetical protein
MRESVRVGYRQGFFAFVAHKLLAVAAIVN